MLYAAKCYWPGVSQRELERMTAQSFGASEQQDVSYVGSLLFADDHLVLCLFEAPSRAAVIRASERSGIPCERVMNSVWLDPRRTNAEQLGGIDVS
jgi:Protein of unknown function (DUF4242)